MIKLKRWGKLGLLTIWGLSVLAIFLLITLASIALLTDNKAIQDTVVFNRVTLLMGLISLPSALMSLLNIMSYDKKEYVVTTKCPNCKHLVEIKLRDVNADFILTHHRRFKFDPPGDFFMD